MKNYQFKARDKVGKVKEGVIKADSPQSATQHFKDMGMILISLKEKKSSESIFSKFNLGGSVKIKDIMIFTRQMYALCVAGLPLVNSLKSLENSSSNKYFCSILTAVRRDIESGSSFSASLAKYPKVFDNIFCSSIKAGEASGSLPEVLRRLAISVEKDADTREKIKQAMSYPVIILCVIVLALFAIGLFVIPQFENLFKSFGVDELPIFTRILLTTSNIMKRFWYICIFGMFVFVGVFKYCLQTPVGKAIADAVLLKTPIFGSLYVKISMSRFGRTVATLVKSGVPIVETLDLAARTSNNGILFRSMIGVKEKVKEGKGIAASMGEETMFPDMIVQMVAAGEEAGRVDELMEMVADYYESEADIVIKNLTTLLEPFLLIFIAGMVLVLALGIFMPLWQLQSSAN
jgi:type II secretory pathway component PulF